MKEFKIHFSGITHNADRNYTIFLKLLRKHFQLSLRQVVSIGRTHFFTIKDSEHILIKELAQELLPYNIAVIGIEEMEANLFPYNK